MSLRRYRLNPSVRRPNLPNDKLLSKNTQTLHLYSGGRGDERVACAIKRIAPRLGDGAVLIEGGKERHKPFLPVSHKVQQHQSVSPSKQKTSAGMFLEDQLKLTIPKIHSPTKNSKIHSKSINIRLKSLTISDVLRRQKRAERRWDGPAITTHTISNTNQAQRPTAKQFRAAQLPREQPGRTIHQGRRSNLLQKRTSQQLPSSNQIRSI